ncbi:uncharacterized protein LOC135458306 [Zonotrichia leucophrys gambelii]|uniref:uncharacterized protein LOC135458306 n=1 Tax=Zonotrichia leucophrys gambelii TaxID=257770 RepID=UPI0031404D28
MRRARAAALVALAVLLIVAAVKAQVQQEAFLQTTEGTSISIKCSHANIRTGDFIHFYRQLPGKRPELLAVTAKAPKAVRVPKGRLTVSADRRSSSLWLAEPRRGDAAVYYCALGATGRGAGAAAGHEPPRAGPAGGAAAPPAGAAESRSSRAAATSTGNGTDRSTANRTGTGTGYRTGIVTCTDTRTNTGTDNGTGTGTNTANGHQHGQLTSKPTPAMGPGQIPALTP